MDSLFTEAVYCNIIERLTALGEHSKANWGKMSVGQMLNHCQQPLNLALQKKDYKLKTNWLAKLFFKKAMYGDRPWPKNFATVPGFKVTDPKLFSTEMQHLKHLITEFHQQKDRSHWPPHPVFGNFTPEQWGKMQFKHLDHHLRQFGV